MKKLHYTAPCVEEIYLSLQGMLAQSTDGSLEDMPGDIIFDTEG